MPAYVTVFRLASYFLTLALASLWWHSYREGRWSARAYAGPLALASAEGLAVVEWRAPPVPRNVVHDLHESYSSFGVRYGWAQSVGPLPGRPATQFRELRVPYPWLIALTLAPVFLSPAVARMVARMRRHRVVEGTCTRCGYDLRASPQRCPECGLEVPT